MSRCPTCGGPRSVLTDAQVRELRELRAAGANQYDLAERFGISQALVSNLVRGLRRPEAGGPIETQRLHAKRRTA